MKKQRILITVHNVVNLSKGIKYWRPYSEHVYPVKLSNRTISLYESWYNDAICLIKRASLIEWLVCDLRVTKPALVCSRDKDKLSV